MAEMNSNDVNLCINQVYIIIISAKLMQNHAPAYLIFSR